MISLAHDAVSLAAQVSGNVLPSERSAPTRKVDNCHSVCQSNKTCSYVNDDVMHIETFPDNLSSTRLILKLDGKSIEMEVGTGAATPFQFFDEMGPTNLVFALYFLSKIEIKIGGNIWMIEFMIIKLISSHFAAIILD